MAGRAGYESAVSRHTALAATVVGLLVALAIAVSLVSLPEPVALGLFVVVVGLAGILVFRFNPDGDVWELSQRFGINPWIAVVVVLAAAILLLAVRVALVDAV
jgi:uncharacterized membrane protein